MTYQSSFSNRYASDEMRRLWSDPARRMLWRRVWIAVAQVQVEAGLVTAEQLEDLKEHSAAIDLPRALEIESEIGHDLMAELKTYAEQCSQGGSILHWGLTSADVQDNADILRQRTALSLLLEKLKDLLLGFAGQIKATAALPVMGYTHLQPAEPITLGYRLGVTAQDLLGHYFALQRLRASLRGKGIKGAVGSSATFVDILENTPMKADEFENSVMKLLGLKSYFIAGQTYPRVQDFQLLSVLSGLAASMHKFALDLRVLQSPGIGILAEPFGKKQVGSSAMPFKRNPIRAEKICSLARLVQSSAATSWHNAADNILERTLDDSANRRTILPEAFLALDEILITCKTIIDGLVVDEMRSEAILEKYGPFAATERILSALVMAGADRVEMHERLRTQSLTAWEAVRLGKPNPLIENICADTSILKYIQPTQVRSLFDTRTYLGLAPEKAEKIAAILEETFKIDEEEQTD
jgi:adenylosuccinate lyase